MSHKNKQRLLITGVSGLLGGNLAYYFKDKYEILGLYYSHPVIIYGVYTEKCDISQFSNIESIVKWFKPSVIIHCASLTNVDQCETERDMTRLINTLSTRHLVESISNHVTLIYISTDSVYDGGAGNFSELDEAHIAPQNYYGTSKYEGEIESLNHSNTLVLRTNIFGWNIQPKKSLGEWILDELKAQRQINCFKDAYFSSIYTMELSRVIDIAIQKNLTGIFNCGSADSCSKYEFALKIADYFGFNKELVIPISIDKFNFRAKRGKNLSLNVNGIQKALDYKLPTIDQSIESFYRDYKSGMPELMKINQLEAQPEGVVLPYGHQYIGEDDIHAVVDVMRSARLTQGPKVDEFERELAQYCGAKYAVAVSSGTAALHLACLAAGINEGHEAVTSPVTFVASANCILYCHGRPVLADIDGETYNIAPSEIRNRLTSMTRSIIPVHFAGLPCDMERIRKISDEHGLIVIEDACHALGSKWQESDGKWHLTGSCSHSDMTVFSFHPVKHITTGEGGAITTNSEELYKKLMMLRSHGITRESDKFVNKKLAFSAADVPNPWYYEMQELGFNLRITDIQCALGLSQLKKLDSFVSRRREIVSMYNKAFENISCLKIPVELKTHQSSWHLYVVQIDFEKLGKSRCSIMNKLYKQGVGTQVHYIPVHLQPYYRSKLGYKEGDYPIAEAYYSRTLSLPLFPKMTDEEVEKVIRTVISVFN